MCRAVSNDSCTAVLESNIGACLLPPDNSGTATVIGRYSANSHIYWRQGAVHIFYPMDNLFESAGTSNGIGAIVTGTNIKFQCDETATGPGRQTFSYDSQKHIFIITWYTSFTCVNPLNEGILHVGNRVYDLSGLTLETSYYYNLLVEESNEIFQMNPFSRMPSIEGCTADTVSCLHNLFIDEYSQVSKLIYLKYFVCYGGSGQ